MRRGGTNVTFPAREHRDRTRLRHGPLGRVVSRDGVRAAGRAVSRSLRALAAGLDTRPYRLPLSPSLRWVEVDFPDVIAYKQAQLAGERPACALEQVGIDLTDVARRRALFDRIGRPARRVLVVSEGLLIYLPPEAVAALAADLAVPPSFRWWLIDLASPRLLKMMERTWGRAVAQGNAPFRFAAAEGTRVFEPHGWREAEFRSMWEESLRLRRTMPLAWLWNLVGKLYPKSKRDEFRRMSGIVLLERT